jgi:hypothetical protein
VERASPDLVPALTPRGCGLPVDTSALLESAGFGIVGVLPITDYDARVPDPWRSSALLPGARSAYVLGTGGGAFEAGWLAAESGPTPRAGHPADEHARAVLRDAVATLERETGERADAWLYCDRAAARGGEPVFADFVGLAEACGLGARSPLGLLLHPAYGPWWSVRALMLTSVAAPAWGPADPSIAHAPCADCSAPCAAACPGDAVSPAGFDARACSATRLSGPSCAAECAARRACVVGPEHRYDPRAEAHYASASLDWLRGSASPSGEGTRRRKGRGDPPGSGSRAKTE